MSGADSDGEDFFLRKIWTHRVPDMLECMATHNLILHITTAALASDNATSYLSQAIIGHLTAHHFTMPPPTHVQGYVQDMQAPDQIFYRNVWQLVTIGYKRTSRGGAAHKLTASTIPYHLMTWHNLFSGVANTNSKDLTWIINVVDRPLIFIGMIVRLCLK
jgi:hypothetical protein